MVIATWSGLAQICLSSSLQTLQVFYHNNQYTKYYLWSLQTELPELPDENKKESESSNITLMIIGVLCFLLLCATHGIIALSIKRWSKKKTPAKLLHMQVAMGQKSLQLVKSQLQPIGRWKERKRQ